MGLIVDFFFTCLSLYLTSDVSALWKTSFFTALLTQSSTPALLFQWKLFKLRLHLEPKVEGKVVLKLQVRMCYPALCSQVSALVTCLGLCAQKVSLYLHPAGVDGDCVLALLAADRAAPGELAWTSLHHLSPARSVPRPAAHQLTAIWSQPRGSYVERDITFLLHSV